MVDAIGTCDLAWNLNYRTNNGSLSTFIVDNKNELTNAFSAANVYDQNGSLTSANGGHNEYVYDDENRLIQWFFYHTDSLSRSNNDLRTDFFYDGLGRLRERLEYVLSCPMTNGGGGGAGPVGQPDSPADGCSWGLTNAVLYFYDGWRVIQERDGNNTPTVAYTRGNDLSASMEGAGGIGGLLARSAGYSSGNFTAHHFYFADGNGNVTWMLDASQGTVARYRYDPFGNLISSSGTLASANVYRFSSKEIHANSGMYYYGYRFYDPNLQRWINTDPLLDRGFRLLSETPKPYHPSLLEINLYAFIRNRTVSRFDGLGLQDAPGDPDLDLGAMIGRCLAIAHKRYNEYRDMVEKGQDKPGTDHWFHCVTSCEMTRVCGPGIAEFFGDLKERLQHGGETDTWLDQQANKNGRDCGDCKNKKSCVQCCEEKGWTR